MSLKTKVNEKLKRVYHLTEIVKKIVPIHDFTKNQRTNRVLLEVLNEYRIVANEARELLSEYIREERKRGIIPLDYIRTYRKLGEENAKS